MDLAHLRAARARLGQVRWLDPASREVARRLVYGGEGRRVSLFIVPRLTMPPLEGNEHEVEGVDVYTTAAGGLQLGWWNHGGDLYLAATNAGDGDLIGFATLCVRARRSDMPEGGRGPRGGNLRREDSPGRRGS